MKILFATPYAKNTGGITRWAEHIVSQYKSLPLPDVSLDLLPMNHTNAVIGNGITGRIKTGICTYSKVISSLKKSLTCQKYDILHIASSASISLIKDILMLNIARRRGVKTIIHFHFGRIPELCKQNNWEWKLLRKVVKMADKAIVIDDASYNTLVNAGFKNIENLPNPLSPQIQCILNENKSINRDNRTILFAGHCLRTKGVCELIEACKQIPDVRLNLLGAITPEMKEYLCQLSDHAQWLNIMGQRTFNDVIKEMMACTIFVLPTYTEGFPNVILESMACACPIITTPVGAIPQMLDINSGAPCGICVPSKDIDSLRDAINKLLVDKNQRIFLALNAQKRVNQQYSITSVWNQLLKIWRNIANE